MYGEAVPQLLGNALQSGTWYFAAGNARNNFVSRIDIAEALANVISQPFRFVRMFSFLFILKYCWCIKRIGFFQP